MTTVPDLLEMNSDSAPDVAGRWRQWIGPLAAIVILALAMVVLRKELGAHTYREISDAVRGIPRAQLAQALWWTVLAYLVLPGYDILALAYAGRLRDQPVTADATAEVKRGVGLTRAAFAGIISYGVSQTLGFAAFTGSAVRYRFWSAWGLSTAEIARGASFAAATFTLGVIMVCGLAFTLEPATELTTLHLPAIGARALGAVLLLLVLGFLGWSVRAGGRPMQLRGALARRIGRSESGVVIEVPRPSLAFGQIAVALVDWAAAAAVLWVLLPVDGRLPFPAFAGVFVIAHCTGLISHVPGGLGIFETLIVLALRPFLPAGTTLAALVAYRAVYYLLPFVMAVVMIAGYELRRRNMRIRAFTAAASRTADVVSDAARRTATLANTLGPSLIPTIVAGAVFAAGVVLLISGATPSLHPRVTALHGLLPIGVIEASHLLGSVAGALLLVLAWALHRRLGAAWGLTIVLLLAGAATSLLKGLDWEEALVQCAVLLIVLPFRRAFYRKAALTGERFEPEWIVAIVAVLGLTAWVGLFAYRHVEYANDLWWRVRPQADAPRFLRAMLASAGALVVFGASRLLRPARPEQVRPDGAQLSRAATIVQHSTDSGGHLALLGDKSLLFLDEVPPVPHASSRAGIDGFVQYGVLGRSWVSMGDPIIADDILKVSGADGSLQDSRRARSALAWRFKEEADAHGGWPVFYEVSPETLPLYIDLGLTFLKLGEEARVDLTTFALDGASRRKLRRVVSEVERTGARFEIIPAADVPQILPALQAVSDDWLAKKSVREKGFSLGSFDATYLSRCPVAVIRMPGDAPLVESHDTGGSHRADDIVAFSNLWVGGGHEELSVDLMRFSERAPRGVMDFLFIQLMLWGRAEGYQRFNLGMAPLAGLEARELAPLWTKAGAWLYRHGEHFYNYDGLRRYKEKFDPVWEPRYLASPGGLALPRILANVASLIAGGLGGLVRK